MMNKDSFQEKVLIGRLKLKDKDAFSQIYDLYIDRIYRFIYFKVSRKEDAEDITSQVFLKIWDYTLLGNIKIGESFQALLYKTARNLVIDHYRVNQKKDSSNISLENVKEIASDDNVGKAIDTGIAMTKIEQDLKKLKSEYQEVIVLHYINELSIKEIAEILNKKRGNVRVLLHRAIKTLQSLHG